MKHLILALTGAYEWLASVPTWVIVLAMILGIAVAAFRALLPSWGRRAAGLLLLVALVGCELPTATPEQETPEQAQAVAGPPGTASCTTCPRGNTTGWIPAPSVPTDRGRLPLVSFAPDTVGRSARNPCSSPRRPSRFTDVIGAS